MTAAIDENNLTVLHGNTYPLALPEYDRGAAPSGMALHRMQLVLKRSPELETALETLLDEQQDKSSPNYHKWLTPGEFGQQFGPADEDVQAITSWLQSHGFEVAKVSNGRTVIEFSGSVAQVASAFHTEIHKYTVNGEDHWANASDPQIPAALAPAVAGVLTLHNFPRKAMHQLSGTYKRDKNTGKAVSIAANAGTGTLFTLPAPNGCGVQPSDCYALSPYDFGTIYDLLPLWTAAPKIDGTGEMIAVVAESNINPQDISDFRNYFGLSNPPNLKITVSGPDPGPVSDAETEADLDVEWSGAIAPNATINLVVSESTEVSLGADLAAVFAVDNNLAPVLNVSYGICELGLGTTGNQFFNQLWQQAAAQGITVLVSTGDSGAAVCDRDDGPPPAPAVFGLTVSGFSTTPYNVAIGGTDFNDLTDASTYWSLQNKPPGYNPSALATASAKSYIPETTWNDTCTNGVFGSLLGFSTNAETNCNNPELVDFVTAVGGSGGKSNCITSDGQDVSSCTGGYSKPTWQVGTGVPNDNARDVPDASLYSSVNSPSGSFYIICEADALPPGTSSCDPTNPDTEFLGIGGTSASAPTFSAIMALVNQKTNTQQGNANYVLYKLAAQQPSAFHDIPVGGTIAMPCAKGSPDCTVTNPSDFYGVLSGYSTTAGYDLATGLGSVDANNLVTKWDTIITKPSSTTLAFSPSPVNTTHGQPVNVNIAVAAVAPATGTPTGNVSLIANTAPPDSPPGVTQQGTQGYVLSNGSVSSTTNVLPGGSYTVVAQYPGDGTFGPSTSSPIFVTVAKEASQASIALELFNPSTGFQTNPNATTAQYGSLELLRMNLTSQTGDTCIQSAPLPAGCPTGSVMITNNSVALDAGTYQLNSLGYTEDQAVQLPGGTDNLKLTYPGDNSFVESTGTATIIITKAPSNVVLSAPGSAILGGFVTMTAEITSVGLGVGPTGLVTFFSGTTQLGNPVPVTNSVAGSFNGTPSAQATINTSQLPLGLDVITAQYSGDGNYSAATSPPNSVDVMIPTNCSLNSSNLTITHGSSVTFTLSVTATQPGGPGLTGTVIFSDFAGQIGSMALTNNQAQITTSTLPGGSIQINANYSGDGKDYSSCGASLVETVNLLATTTTVSTSNAAIPQGQSVTLTAHVAAVQPGGPAPTGTVQFFSAVTLTGSDNPIGSPVLLSNGQAQITTAALPTNTQFVFASYSGDSNYANSTGSVAQTVTPPPDFSAGANPTTVVISNPGASGSTTLTFTALNGLSGTFNLVPQCGGLPAESNCSVSPSSITFSSTMTSATATLMIGTTAPSSAAAAARIGPNGGRIGALIALSVFFLVSMLYWLRKQRRMQIAFSLFAFLALLTFASCSGGGGGGGGGNLGTPKGVYPNGSASFTLGSASHSVAFTVDVQ